MTTKTTLSKVSGYNLSIPTSESARWRPSKRRPVALRFEGDGSGVYGMEYDSDDSNYSGGGDYDDGYGDLHVLLADGTENSIPIHARPVDHGSGLHNVGLYLKPVWVPQPAPIRQLGEKLAFGKKVYGVKLP